MLKLNASFSKKVPAEQDYSSKGYSATVEVELPDGLTQEQLQERISQTFALVEASVEKELNGNTEPVQMPPVSEATPVVNKVDNEKASPKQVKYLLDLARQRNIRLVDYFGPYGIAEANQLNRKQCSLLIDQLRDQAA